MFKRKFNVPASLHDRSPIKAFSIREVTGRDEMDAVGRVYDQNTGRLVGGPAAVRNELIASSVVEVDGKPVEGVYTGFYELPMRVRTLIVSAFDLVNSVSDEDLAAFLKADPPAPVAGTGSTTT